MSIITTATERLIANAERIIADYVEATEAWSVAREEALALENDGDLADDIDHDIIAWYESSTDAFWGIANWVSNNGTPEQKAFIAREAKDFAKVWVWVITGGYWKDM